jgi:hypothetical protein
LLTPLRVTSLAIVGFTEKFTKVYNNGAVKQITKKNIEVQEFRSSGVFPTETLREQNGGFPLLGGFRDL